MQSSNENYKFNYNVGLMATFALYILCFGWILVSTDYFPYVLDNNESFSVLWHSYNLANFDFFKSFGVTDDVYSIDESAHPFAHTHQGNWPRVFGYLIFQLGATTVESQIFVTTATIGLLSFYFCYHFFAKYTAPLFAVLFCAFLMTDYILYTQWHVVTYRVWQLFFLFSTLLCVRKIGEGEGKVLMWGALTVFNYACLYYSELVYVAFVSGIAGLYAITLYWRRPKFLTLVVACQIGGAVLGLGILALQLIGYYGIENLKQDFWFTFMSRNHAHSTTNLMAEMRAFYGGNNIAFWYNMDDNSKYLSAMSFVRSFFSFDFQTHTPVFTILTMAMALPFAGLLTAPNAVKAKQDSTFLNTAGFVLSGILFLGCAGFLTYTLQRGANGLALLAGVLVVGSLLMVLYRLSSSGAMKALPPVLLRVADALLDLGVFLAFLLLAMALSSPGAVEGMPPATSWLRDRDTVSWGMGIVGAALTVALLKGLLGHGLAKIPDYARSGAAVTIVVVFSLATLIRHQQWFYNQGFQPLIRVMGDNFLPLSLVALGIYIAAVLSALVIMSAQSDSSSTFWKPVKHVRAYLICGFLAYIVVFSLSAGYVHTGYLHRSTPFTVFLTNALLALGAYIVIRFAYLAIKSPESMGLRFPRLSLAVPGVVLVVLFGFWGGLQLKYVKLLPPDHFAFLKKLAKEPYKGKTFVVGNYAAPAAAFAGKWAYMAFDVGGDGWKETAKGFVKNRNIDYLWVADRTTNPAYAKPDYYLCMSNQTLGTLNATIANKNGASNVSGCSPMIDGFNSTLEKSPILRHKIVSQETDGVAKRGWISWAIAKLDWDFPPIALAKDGSLSNRPVEIKLSPASSQYRVAFDYRYFHQDGTLEGESIAELVQLGENAQCENAPSQVTVLDSHVGKGNGDFLLPTSYTGKVGVRVKPVSASRSASWWYYSDTISLAGAKQKPMVCPVNLASETNMVIRYERPVGDKVDLLWSGVIDADYYDLQMNREGGAWQSIGKIEKHTKTYSIHNIAVDASYGFRVRACDDAGTCSPFGPETTAPLPNSG